MTWGAPAWIWPAVALGVVALAALVWSYRSRATSVGVRATAFGFKLLGVLLLLFCLTEPLVRRVRAQPGANQLLVLVDDSRSLSVRDRGATRTRAEEVLELLREDQRWLLRAGQDFDLRRHAFASRVRSFETPDQLSFEGSESSLARALERLAARSAGHPVAGILLVSDGVATDRFPAEFDWAALPPVHTVVVGARPARDLALSRLEVSQTNFEETPVTIRADVRAVDCAGESLAVELRDEEGEVLERQVLTAADGEPQEVRFHAPIHAPGRAPGQHFYSVRVGFAEPANLTEATKANNERWAVVDRGAGAFRVLYVSGRPNWEFKFLNRALEEDAEIELVGLLRIARSQPRFSFREGADRRNALWGGFDNRDEEVGEQYDEPVLLRTSDEPELKGGFPTKAEDLFGYDGLVLDDLEAAFFTPDQQALIEQFVSRRGAGFLVLGGEQSYLEGGYRRTPLGDLLPVYLDVRMADGPVPVMNWSAGYSLELTREGWLEPWVRLRSTEDLEQERLAAMPPFRTLNRVGEVKPGGSVLIEARDVAGNTRPALVAHRFGRGRSAAMLVGDLWRWDLHRAEPAVSDLGTAWRQVLRWLVADVPRRVELEASRGERSGEIELTATLRDPAFEAVHNARVTLEISPPGGETFELDATPSATAMGAWVTSFVPRASGPYRARLRARGEDQSELGRAETGWVSAPETDEFRSLEPDRALLADLAQRTGGSLLAPDELADFVSDLARQEVPITQEELDPLWHRWWVFFLALACLCVEWGVRRFQGLP